MTSTGVVRAQSPTSPGTGRDGHVGPEGDLWSLGVTLFAAVEGRSPRSPVQPDESHRARHRTAAGGAACRRTGLVLEGLLRKDPDERLDAETAELLLRRALSESSRRRRAALAANELEGWCAHGPSMRSDQTVSDDGASRWVMSAWSTGAVGVGEERVIAPDREQRVCGSWRLAPGARPAGAVISWRVSANAVYGTSATSSVGDQLAGVGIVQPRPDSAPGTNASSGMLSIAASTAGLLGDGEREPAPRP